MVFETDRSHLLAPPWYDTIRGEYENPGSIGRGAGFELVQDAAALIADGVGTGATPLGDLLQRNTFSLSVSLAQALLRAIAVDVLDQRLEALQAVLLNRKDHKP